MRKPLILISFLALAACATSRDFEQEKRQFEADVDALGQEAQTAYYTCRFVRHLWHCRDEIWQKQTKPHAPPGDQREFLLRYIDAVERRGANHVLKAQKLPCGEVISLDYFFWSEGQEAVCSDGNHYRIERDNKGWRVTLLNEAHDGL
jgi:hypothetical protein